MDIKIADVCGLCAGCKIAINTAKELLDKGEDVTIFKEIVHNKNVNKFLKQAGASFEEDVNNLKTDSTIIIRAHGESPKIYDCLNKKNIKFKDCTCFNVKRIHEEVKKHYEQGYSIILIGKHKNDMHPEVEGTLGWANDEAILIQDETDLKQIEKLNKKAYLVCQTTFNINKANLLIEKIENIFKEKSIELKINKSICSANNEINLKSIELARQCDLMIVVGGKNSSNTKELFNVLNEITNTIFVEDITEYKKELLENNYSINSSTKIGITAGASTMKEELQELKQLIISEFE